MKPILIWKVLKYVCFKFATLPKKPYNATKVNSENFRLVPVYDMINCIAIESDKDFDNIEFLML